MYPFDAADTLELVGVAAGLFVALVGLGTLLGMPWETAESTPALVLQLVGIVLTVGVGVFLIWLSRPTGVGGSVAGRRRDT